MRSRATPPWLRREFLFYKTLKFLKYQIRKLKREKYHIKFFQGNILSTQKRLNVHLFFILFLIFITKIATNVAMQIAKYTSM